MIVVREGVLFAFLSCIVSSSMSATNLQVIDLELGRSAPLLELQHAFRTLLVAESLGDERILA